MARVSVILATYNSGGTVGQAIESVLAQTYQDFEIIVVDDASTDNTREVLDGYARRPDKIRVIHRETNGGAGAARNAGVRASRGEYIAFLDSDDVYLPRRLEVAVACLDASPDAGAVYLDCEVRGPDGGLVCKSLVGSSGCTKRVVTWRDVARHEPMHTNTITIRRPCLEQVGLFNEELRRGQDSELWLRLSYRCRVEHTAGVVAVWNHREASSEGLGSPADALRTVGVWRAALTWLSDSRPEDVRFAERELARAYWRYAIALRLKRSPQGHAAYRNALAYCVEHKMLAHAVAGRIAWHLPRLLLGLQAAAHSGWRLRAWVRHAMTRGGQLP